MNNNGFKYNIVSRKIKRTLSQNSRAVYFPHNHQIKTIGLITDDGRNVEFVSSAFNVSVNTLLFSEAKREKGDESDVVYQSDLGFLRIPAKVKVKHFIENDFDILICLTDNFTQAMGFTCALSIAKFKAGMHKSPVFDLVINQNGLSKEAVVAQIVNTIENFS